MEQLMYGSTHTHFEDMFDTGNDLEQMILRFAEQGAKKVAVTGHGNMFALEDLKGIVKNLKKKDEIPQDFEILPGVEVYFEEKAKHMVLVAKNYDGYVDLCKVITDSAANTKRARSGEGNSDNEYPTPIVTLENLEKNIRKGNVYATSACIGGVFCVDLGLVQSKLQQKYGQEIARKNAALEKKLQKFSKEEIEAAEKVIADYTKFDKDPAYKNPTKAEKERVNKRIAKGIEGAEEELSAILDREQKVKELAEWKLENKPEYDAAKDYLKKYNAVLKAMEQESKPVTKAREALEEYSATEEERWQEAKDLYQKFEAIFGKEDFYFELQNHGLDIERSGFNNMVRLAYEVGNPNFIASNDVHIGDVKGSDTWKTSVLKRDMEKFLRFGVEDKDRGDKEEYGIKNDAQLKEMLLQIIEPYVDAQGITHTPEEIIDSAIGHIRGAMEPCKVEFPEISIGGLNHYPKYCDDEKAMLRERVEKGLEWRFPEGLPEGYRERVEYELGIILNMGYAGYHLIVQDYLDYGRLLGYLRNQKEIDEAPLTIEGLNEYIDKNHIPRIGMGLGPGRGSAAGSLCCYALGITDIDPIKYGLLFERFLNPDRQSMPDIDSDFRNEVKDKMYEYVKLKYGEDCVSRVATKSYAYGRTATGTVERYLWKKREEELKKAYPERTKLDKGDAYTRAKNDFFKKEHRIYLDAEAKLSAMITSQVEMEEDLSTQKIADSTKAIVRILKNDDKIRERMQLEGEAYKGEQPLSKLERQICEMAVQISGIPKTLSMHPCGAIISKDPIKDIIPMAWNADNQVMTTQCLYPQAEDLGMLKMDMLMLKNLSVITNIMQETGDKRLMNLKERDLIMEDKSLYQDIFGKGLTKGCFQVESPGMTKMFVNFQPSCFEDIVLLVAAYRPGPMDFIPEVIARKWYNELGKEEYQKKIQEIYPFSEKAYQEAKDNDRAYMYDKDGNILTPPPSTLDINNEKLDKILEPTYGVPIYQEQVMEIFKQLAGYTPGQADMVRKYMGKKKIDALAMERPDFIYGNPERGITGCMAAGISEKDAGMLFDKLAEFSKYAFNKSHAACYAQISVFTAYQKREYPREFYKFTIANEIKGAQASNKDSVIMKYMQEMTDAGIRIFPPAIGKSSDDISNEGEHDLRLGYGNIKGESYGTVYRDAGSIQAFILKNPSVSAKTVKNFISVGMFNACWSDPDHAAEVRRANGNRKEMERWVDRYFEKSRDLGLVIQEIKELENEISVLEECISTGNFAAAHVESLEDAQAKLKSDKRKLGTEHGAEHDTLYCKRSRLKSELKTAMLLSKEAGNEPDVEPAMEMEYLDIEKNKLGFPFSIRGNMENLKKEYGENAASFTKDKIGHMQVPAIIISKQEKLSKKGKKYYNITAVDIKGNLEKMTCFSELTQNEGLFRIEYRPADERYGKSCMLEEIVSQEKEAEKKQDTVFTTVAGKTVCTYAASNNQNKPVPKESALDVIMRAEEECENEMDEEERA